MGPRSGPLMQLCSEEGEEHKNERNLTRRAHRIKRRRETDGTRPEPPTAQEGFAAEVEENGEDGGPPASQEEQGENTTWQPSTRLTEEALQRWCQQLDASERWGSELETAKELA